MKRVYWLIWDDGYIEYYGTDYCRAIEQQVQLGKFGIHCLFKSELREIEEETN